MTDSERDAGFCSGVDEDDLSGLHSPSASEDSVEVNVTTISSLRNKRKLIEPRKFEDLADARPLKKRRRFETENLVCDEESRSIGTPSPSPFRPWSVTSSSDSRRNHHHHPSSLTLDHATCDAGKSGNDRRVSVEDNTVKVEVNEAQNLAVDVMKRREEEALARLLEETPSPESVPKSRSAHSFQRREHRRSLKPVSLLPPTFDTSNHQRLPQEEPLSLVLRGQCQSRVPSHPAVNGTFERPSISSSSSSSSSSSRSSCPISSPHSSHPGVTNASSVTYATGTRIASSTTLSSNGHQTRHQQAGQQRNYKNMTRERRIEANARERTRVHTISAAFDTLRKAIPAYSHNQKLSKLSVLRIACSYIMTLGKIIEQCQGDTGKGRDTLEGCVDLVSRTIQTEGKLRKKKDD